MKWKPAKGKRADRNVIDVRGAKRSSSSSSGGGVGGLGGGLSNLPIPGGIGGLGGGLGTIVVIVVIALQVFGGGGSPGTNFDVGQILGGGAAPPGAENPQPLPPSEDPQKDLVEFSKAVFTDVQNTWAKSFKADGEKYSDAQLVLYSGAVTTGGCGSATSAVGPFYCPGDSKVYLDPTFYDDMKKQLNAPGTSLGHT